MTEFKLLPTELRRLANELRGYASVEGVARALDGLANDIQSQAHDGAVAYLIADNGDDRLRMVSESEFYKWPNERVQFYTAPPRVVIDEAMVLRACNAYDDARDHESRSEYPAMHAALKSALEQSK